MSCSDRPPSGPPPSFSRLYPERPIVGVGTVVWHADRVLLVRRGKPPRVGQWSLPGGAQEVGETLAQTAAREIREEAGIEVTMGKVVATLDLIEHDPDGRVRTHYTLVDFVAVTGAHRLEAGGDALDARWFDLEDLPALGLWSETLRIIELARRERPCP